MSNEGRQANKRWYWTGHSFTGKCSWMLGPTVAIVSLTWNYYILEQILIGEHFISWLLPSCPSGQNWPPKSFDSSALDLSGQPLRRPAPPWVCLGQPRVLEVSWLLTCWVQWSLCGSLVPSSWGGRVYLWPQETRPLHQRQTGRSHWGLLGPESRQVAKVWEVSGLSRSGTSHKLNSVHNWLQW